jgi:ribosome-associated protein
MFPRALHVPRFVRYQTVEPVPTHPRLQWKSVSLTNSHYERPTNEFSRMKKSELKRQVADAIQACLDKKAEELSVLEMEKGSGAFTDYFVLCSGTNPRQVQAIADEVELRLKAAGLRPTQVEGYRQAEWILVDYVDFVVHVFSEKARKFYDLERLWKTARRLEPSDLKPKPRAAREKSRTAIRKAATPRKRSTVSLRQPKH